MCASVVNPLTLDAQHVTLDGGIRVHYLTGGTGRPLVMLGGLASSVRASWGALLPHLLPSFHIYAVDLPGQGDSDKPAAAYSVHYAVDALVNVLDTLKLEQVDILGASLGGMVTLSTVLEHPGRVRRAAVVGSAGIGQDVTLALRLATLPLLGEVATTPRRSWIKMGLRYNFADPRHVTDELVDEFYRARRLPGAQAVVLRVLRSGVGLGGLRPSAVLGERLRQVAVPTLVLWGRQDRVLPVGHAYRAAELIPDARLHVFEDTGHDVATERPAELTQILKDFLL